MPAQLLTRDVSARVEERLEDGVTLARLLQAV
jgi:hypothetical protein